MKQRPCVALAAWLARLLLILGSGRACGSTGSVAGMPGGRGGASRLVAVHVTSVGSWIGRECEDVRNGLPTALVRALGVCDGRVRAVHAR